MLCFTAPEARAPARGAGAATTAQTTAPSYARHVPERTLLYALVQANYPDFIARLEAEERSLPAYVREEFEAFLRCAVLDHGFLRVVCEHCHAERLVALLWLDGVYEDSTEQPQQPPRKPRLRRARAPAQLTELAGKIAHRVCRHLTRKGWLEGEGE